MTTAGFDQLNLSAPQLDNLASLGYDVMTEIQAAVLPTVLAGQDVIAQAQTGSGKTAAFSLPLLAKINPRDFGVQGLVLCPTRELATQVAGEIRRLARHQQNIKVVVLCGGRPIGPQIGSLEHGAHIIIGTPGRIGDHLRKQTVVLDRVKTLVLDEADRMLEMGFIDAITDIIEQTPRDRQTLLFSATYPDDIRRISRRFQTEPVTVTVDNAVKSAQIEQRFFVSSEKQKLAALDALLGYFQPDQSLVFCNTKQGVRDVTDLLRKNSIEALAIHGDLEQRDRDQMLIQFRQKSCRVLVATDVAARGLDIANLSAVINFDIPRDQETYLHRIGRTGRAGQDGLALTLITENERHRLEKLNLFLQRAFITEKTDSLAGSKRPLPPAEFVTLCIGAGRKDKVRPGDILGALTGSGGIEGSAIGKIDITDYAAYVAIQRAFANQALQHLNEGKIKGRKFKVRKLSSRQG